MSATAYVVYGEIRNITPRTKERLFTLTSPLSLYPNDNLSSDQELPYLVFVFKFQI